MTKMAMDDIQKSFIEQEIKDLISQPPPVVRYDSHTKKICVTNDFCCGTIPKIKIIACREHWFEIY